MIAQAGWIFVKTPAGAWTWKHSPLQDVARSRQSSRTFLKLSECIADAKRHGYDSTAFGVEPG